MNERAVTPGQSVVFYRDVIGLDRAGIGEAVAPNGTALTEAQLERMKKLGMSVQLHSRPLIQGVLMHKVHGDKAWDMPPFRRVQDSGIHWGFGTDAFEVNQFRPFMTLYWAVTGKMVGGTVVKSRPWTVGEWLWNSWRPGDRDLPEPVIFTGARGGRGREWKRSEPAGVGASQPAQAAGLST